MSAPASGGGTATTGTSPSRAGPLPVVSSWSPVTFATVRRWTGWRNRECGMRTSVRIA